jgi:hypothetical protein
MRQRAARYFGSVEVEKTLIAVLNKWFGCALTQLAT